MAEEQTAEQWCNELLAKLSDPPKYPSSVSGTGTSDLIKQIAHIDGQLTRVLNSHQVSVANANVVAHSYEDKKLLAEAIMLRFKDLLKEAEQTLICGEASVRRAHKLIEVIKSRLGTERVEPRPVRDLRATEEE